VIAWGPNSTGNKWTFLLQNGHARIEITSGYLEGTRTVNDGNWHHVAVTFANDGTPDITEAKLYIDGTVETTFTASASRTVNTTATGDATIGADIPSAQNRYFLGAIDEPRIYNRALSAGEILALYNAGNQSASAWHRRYYGAAPEDWAAPDSLGLPRLLDYAFGGQPWLADASLFRVRAELAGDRLQLRFNRRVSGTSELLYAPQVSPNFMGWTALAASFIGASPLAEWPGFEEVVFQTDATLAQEAQQYVRVQVRWP
jgi:hypothetical protein